MLKKIFLPALLSVLLAIPSYAIDVTNSNAEGAGSLSYAIQQANSGTDTIININHPNVGTITLTRELTIESNVTINGNGVTIEGTGERRLFRITSGHVVFNAVTFTKGNASSGNGGAVEIDNGSSWAEFSNCTFFGNTAQGYGGAVCVTRGSRDNITRLKHCSIAGNEALTDGGGIAALNGDLRTYSSIITGNTASNDIYASSANDVKASYNITGASNCALDSTNLTGRSVREIFMLNDDGKLALRTVKGVNVLELSGTSIARDAVPLNTDYTLAGDEAGTARPQLSEYDAGAFEALPVPVQSFDLYGIPYIQVNHSGTISAEVYPENASLNTRAFPPYGIEWASTRKDVLTVDTAGNTTAQDIGGAEIDNSTITAIVHGWDADGNETKTETRAFTVYVGKEPASEVRASITSVDNQYIRTGSHKLVKPVVKLKVSGIEIENVRAGVNYKLSVSSSNTSIVEAEIVSQDSIRLLAGNTAGSADVEIVASPEPAAGTQAMTRPFTVIVGAGDESDSLGSHHGGCDAVTLGIAFMLVLPALIYKRG